MSTDKPIPSLADAQEEARRARQAFSRLETESTLIREGKKTVEPGFYKHFGMAFDTVRNAEYVVSLAREKERRDEADVARRATEYAVARRQSQKKPEPRVKGRTKRSFRGSTVSTVLIKAVDS